MISYVGFELIPAIGIPALSLLSMVGIGALILRFALAKNGALSRLEFPIVALALGMAVYSLVLFFAGALGLFDHAWVLVLRIAGLLALAFALYGYKPRWVAHAGVDPAWLPLALAGLICSLMTVSAYLSTQIHGDARQYHLASPWLTSMSGRLLQNDTLLHNGTYLGYDILYLSVADLSGLMDSPVMMDQLKLFNAITSMVFPVSVLLLCRAFGGSRAASAIAALAVFTLGAIAYWGFLKNDIFAAAIGIVTLVVLVRAYDQASERLLLVASALAAYAVSVKISNAIPLAIPFGFVYLSRRFSLRTCALSAAMGLLILLPWAVYAYVASGNPFNPVAMRFPDEIKQAWAVRNANGIEPSALNLVTKFIPIVLGQHRISGNETIGILALAVLPASLIALVKDAARGKPGLREVIVACALAWFVFLYVTLYDNRFLSRYLLICFGALFAFMAFKGEIYLQGASKRTKAAVFIAVIALIAVFIWKNPGMASSYARLAGFQGSEQTRHDKETMLGQYSAPYRAIERLRKPGEAVAINDQMTLFLKPPFYNLHALHAVNLNLYRKDAAYVRRYLSERSVRLLLFRKGISGGTKAVDDYMADCAQEIQTFGKTLSLYAVKPSCQ